MKITEYGLGGYDSSKPNDNIVSESDLPDLEVDPKSELIGQAQSAVAALDEADPIRVAVEALANAIAN